MIYKREKICWNDAEQRTLQTICQLCIVMWDTKSTSLFLAKGHNSIWKFWMFPVYDPNLHLDMLSISVYKKKCHTKLIFLCYIFDNLPGRNYWDFIVKD